MDLLEIGAQIIKDKLGTDIDSDNITDALGNLLDSVSSLGGVFDAAKKLF